MTVLEGRRALPRLLRVGAAAAARLVVGSAIYMLFRVLASVAPLTMAVVTALLLSALLHPVVTLLAVTAGTLTAGIAGALIAVPARAVAYHAVLGYRMADTGPPSHEVDSCETAAAPQDGKPQ